MISNKSENSFAKLCNDKYGNYVMQRIYEYSELDLKEEFLSLMNKVKTLLNSQGQYVVKFVQNYNNFAIN